jgi:hypothetical protein
VTAGAVALNQTQQFIQALRQFRLQNIADSTAQLGAAKAQAQRAADRLNQAENKLAADIASGAPGATINADKAEVATAGLRLARLKTTSRRSNIAWRRKRLGPAGRQLLRRLRAARPPRSSPGSPPRAAEGRQNGSGRNAEHPLPLPPLVRPAKSTTMI